MARKGTKKAAKAPRRRAKRAPAAPQVLTTQERARLVKPPENYEELTEKLADKLEALRARVPTKVRPSQLRSLLKKARRARAKEEKLESLIQRRLVPLKDARLIAEDASWRASLKVWKAIKFAAGELPTLLEEFRFFKEALPSGGASSEEPADESEPAGTATGSTPA